ncbi:type II toxin-antitoxin system VapC family toxin [Spirulina sp. CCNP1310]|uniref:type II toxin-antitoxin system VapC family toxin n=1 Tax=Spirulina sp. CCNP1310 TaxID=3110249 RepID=UPI002B1EE123|nr:type II toxin-antitoxin system VapC family toxin [Spirulina sp. CCNP1310]MEA5419712.1 type II toxin-antitoxin system VapC family toxin [Spirulina sp. CCNP1310]
MKLLLDTQCWLWWFAQPEKLNDNAIEMIAEETNEIWFSVASVWEIAIKVSIGKLPLPDPIDHYIPSRINALGAKSLTITNSHALQIATLPLYHRDPFDRILIAQAQIENMTLVSADSKFNQYPVSLLWAGRS